MADDSTGQAGAELIPPSVTPEMLDAGASVLLMAWLSGDEPSGGQRELARDVFEAMVQAQAARKLRDHALEEGV